MNKKQQSFLSVASIFSIIALGILAYSYSSKKTIADEPTKPVLSSPTEGLDLDKIFDF